MQRSTLVAYALPALPLAALTLPLYVLVPTFYSETLGLTLAAVGTALLIVRIFDAVNDPLIGLSNRSWFVKHEVVETTLPGAWLSSRSTSVAA